MLQEMAARYFANTAAFEGEIHVQGLSAATSTVIDLETAACGPATSGEYFELICDQPIFWRVSTNSGATADETATSGANRVFLHPANTPLKFTCDRPRLEGENSTALWRYLAVKTTLASTVRIRRASRRLS